MAKFQKFNPVSFSKNITKTIDAVESKIGKVASTPKTLTEKLNAKTGLNIASPPLPPINANVKGLVSSVKTLVKYKFDEDLVWDTYRMFMHCYPGFDSPAFSAKKEASPKVFLYGGDDA